VILVDTSVWIDHLRGGDAALSTALESGEVLMHPLVVGELACGQFQQRDTILRLLRRLPVAPDVTHDEALRFIDGRRLMGRGIGYVDVHLLASVALADGARLWTRDKRLAGVAAELSLGLTDAF
jgi:predicted nucleic acid-binding protein